MRRATPNSSKPSAFAARHKSSPPGNRAAAGFSYVKKKDILMFDKKSVSLEWAGRTLTIETGQVARQADGAVMVTYGDTKVLATACFAKSAKPGQDFFP